MLKRIVTFLLVVGVALSLSAGVQTREDRRVIEAANVVSKMLHLPENAIPPILFKKAKAVAIFPSVYKAGLIVGGRYGDGVLVVKDDNGHWGNPIFVKIMGGSLGFQIGASKSELVLAFKTHESIDGLVSSKLTLGVDASVAAGPVGREAGVNGDLFLKSEVYAYALTQGLYAGVSLAGSSIIVDDEANMRYYGKDVSPTDIMNNYQVTPSHSVIYLDRVFN